MVLHRALDDELHAHRGRQVEDHVAPCPRARPPTACRAPSRRRSGSAGSRDGLDVVAAAGGEVVDDDDFVMARNARRAAGGRAGGPCDVVFHLAAAVGVRLIVESPVQTIETNVHGTEMVLMLANKKKKRVLIASTSEVYGKSDRGPVPRGRGPGAGATTKGRWSYACSQGHRRVPGPRLLQGEEAAGDRSCGSSTPSGRARPGGTAW